MTTPRFSQEEIYDALRQVRDELRSGEITDEMFDMDFEVNSCGTAGCIGGHMARVLSPECWSRPSGDGNVWQILDGICETNPELYDLFYEYWTAGKQVDRADAADAIDRVLVHKSPWRK